MKHVRCYFFFPPLSPYSLLSFVVVTVVVLFFMYVAGYINLMYQFRFCSNERAKEWRKKNEEEECNTLNRIKWNKSHVLGFHLSFSCSFSFFFLVIVIVVWVRVCQYIRIFSAWQMNLRSICNVQI